MKRLALTTGAAALALGSTLVMAQDRPTDLLPPGFGEPAPAPAPTPTPAQTDAPTPSTTTESSTTSATTSTIQPLPQVPQVSADPSLDVSGLPSIEELEAMSEDDLDDLLGLTPRYDIPPAARRTLERVGIIDASEGGFPETSLSNQPASLVRAAIAGTQRPLVSRWGHILLRRTLASRLDAPSGMNPVEFAALRAGLLNRLGEHNVARALVQDVDTGNYSDALLGAAVDAYVGTADLVGACPAVRLSDAERDDGDWKLLKGICAAYAGEGSRADRDLRRFISDEEVPEIDGLLARRYAGAAGLGRRGVNVEWEGVEAMTPIRFALANALREDIPEELVEDAGAYYTNALATAPMMPIAQRAAAAQAAAAQGILSAAAMVDLYSQVFALGRNGSDTAITASRLRAAYVDRSPTDRLAAINDVWEGDDATLFGRQVLTAYAAARLPVSEDMLDNAPQLIASMLAAGLDRDAMRWARIVPQGSAAWGMLAVAQPSRSQPVSDGQMASFLDQDESDDQHQSQMLLAGLTAMGRLEDAEINEYSERLDVSFGRSTPWTQAISAAADAGNPTLVSLLAGLGMQGSSWDKMTALHLYHIVRSLERVGLEAEARMIAAEAVARSA